jgi:hypothetical protein
VVCVSGNLAHIYFREPVERMTLEEIAGDHPGLIEGLVGHGGIGFVMVRSSQHGAVVMGRDGIRYLAEGRVRGLDPLDGYGVHAAGQLTRLESFPHCGDIVVNGRFDPYSGEVIAFEEMVGAHGGLGGPQTDAFILHPAGWPLPPGKMKSPETLFRVFSDWRDALQGGREPTGGRVDAFPRDAL